MNCFAAVFAFCLVALAGAEECIRGSAIKGNDKVKLSNCANPPCQLKKKTTTVVELKFTPDHDVTKLTNSVNANILGVPFPFIGVDGANVCDKVFDASTGAKASCPLKKGQEYIYRDDFKILEAYPKIRVVVMWELRDQNGKPVLCFEVPARITS